MTTPVPLVTNPLDDYTPKQIAAGLRPRGVAELDMLSKRDRQAYYDFSDAPGSSTLADLWQLNGIAQNPTFTGLTFDGTKGTLASAVSNGITLPFTFTGSFAIYFIVRGTTVGRWLSASRTGPVRAAFGTFTATGNRQRAIPADRT